RSRKQFAGAFSLEILPSLDPRRRIFHLRTDVDRDLSARYRHDRPPQTLATQPFQHLVEALKSASQTCTIVESSCGGLISSSLMSVPGSSKVYFGSTVAYNTKKSGKLLCGDEKLHGRLLNGPPSADDNEETHADTFEEGDLSEEARKYIQTKLHWTRETSLAYCEHMNTDFAIAEGGATGPTFRPKGMDRGFAVLAVAGRKSGGRDVEILAQKVCFSTHADREMNMRLFADSAAELCLEAMTVADPTLSPHDATKEGLQFADDTGWDGSQFLDRSSHIRSTPIMQDLYESLEALNVIVRGTDEILFATPSELALLTTKDLYEDRTLSGTNIGDVLKNQRTFLGRLGPDKTPVFAVFLQKNDSFTTTKDCYFANTRSRAPMLIPIHNELALTAAAFVNWQNTHRFCCICGAPLEFIHGRTCAKCSCSSGEPHLHWPRMDPSIIVLVTNPTSTHALLARSPRHAPYLYTALAGFVEAGETFEKAVQREVHEEVGVSIGPNIDYVASQPWPFPRSCMIGMRAKSLDHGLAPIHIDPKEIVDARWFEKETVYQAARDTDKMGAVLDRKLVEERQAKGDWKGEVLVPSKGVLARTLVDDWLESN
ncbi:hypothetical protein ACHAWF_011959, partial [Thalassiosira exigua]